MADIKGFKKLTAQLKSLEAAAGAKVLRGAMMSATLPAVKAARAAAPVGSPPYASGDPYPVKTYKGRLHAPGFARRSVARKSFLSADKKRITVQLGVKSEAFYAIQFIEFGTSTTPAKPWLEPSFRSSGPSINARLKKELRKRLAAAAKKK